MQPGIELKSPEPLGNTLTTRPMSRTPYKFTCVYSVKLIIIVGCI